MESLAFLHQLNRTETQWEKSVIKPSSASGSSRLTSDKGGRGVKCPPRLQPSRASVLGREREREVGRLVLQTQRKWAAFIGKEWAIGANCTKASWGRTTMLLGDFRYYGLQILHFFFFKNKLKVCGSRALSDDGEHFLTIKYFKIKVCKLFS